MKKKILLTGLFFAVFFLIPISTLCISGNRIDPENDVLILEGYNYQFNLETFSVNDALIKQIEGLKFDYTYTSNEPTLDITKVVIDKQSSDTEFTITIKEACADYPSGDSNIFVLVVIIEYDDDIFGAVHIEHSSLGSISKYGYFSELAEFPHIKLDNFEDFSLSNSNGELSFEIDSDDLPDGSDKLYAVIGQATVSDLDITESNVKFFIGDMRGDVYPNTIYGETVRVFPETVDETDDTEPEDDTDIKVNPFILGFGAMIGFIILIMGFVTIQGRRT